MNRVQITSEGEVISQNIELAVRLPFFKTNIDDFPYYTNGGTLLMVDYNGIVFAVTCSHVFKESDWRSLVVTKSRCDSIYCHPSKVWKIGELFNDALESEVSDVVIFGFDCEITFEKSDLYILDKWTVGDADTGDHLFVYGALKERVDLVGQISVGFVGIYLSDIGAHNSEPFLRKACSSIENSNINSLSGLSGSPVFNLSKGVLSGMVTRGTISDIGEITINYIEFSDIYRVIDLCYNGIRSVKYNKIRTLITKI